MRDGLLQIAVDIVGNGRQAIGGFVERVRHFGCLVQHALSGSGIVGGLAPGGDTAIEIVQRFGDSRRACDIEISLHCGERIDLLLCLAEQGILLPDCLFGKLATGIHHVAGANAARHSCGRIRR